MSSGLVRGTIRVPSGVTFRSRLTFPISPPMLATSILFGDAYYLDNGMWYAAGSATSGGIPVILYPQGELSSYAGRYGGYGGLFIATLSPLYWNYDGGLVQENLSGFYDSCYAQDGEGPYAPDPKAASAFNIYGGQYQDMINITGLWVDYYNTSILQGLIFSCGWSVYQAMTFESRQFATRTLGMDLTGNWVQTYRDSSGGVPWP
jgi:hypothetical protein